MKTEHRIIVALDVDSFEKAKFLVESLTLHAGCFKVGLQLLTAVGAPEVVRFVQGLGGQVFYDGKFYDIPNTVAGASKAVAELGVDMFNVHASGGVEMMRAAVENRGQSKVFAVTVLTSLSEEDIHSIYGGPAKSKVIDFAHLALIAGVDGIICSPQELSVLRSREEFNKLLMVTPGVRPKWASVGDQKRIMTPGEAIRLGADYLVIGRPITRDFEGGGFNNPAEAAQAIASEIEQALKERLFIQLFKAGAIQFGEFKLKMHEKYPEAPKSPIYINLRIPPKGKLTEDIIVEIGEQLYHLACSLGLEYDYIVGLPKAGEPLAKAFTQTALEEDGREIPILCLEKEEGEAGRKVTAKIHGEFEKGKIVLMIDDLITKANTKIEGAEALRQNELVVNDCLVLVDRQQGGPTELAAKDVSCATVFTMSELLDFYVKEGLITPAMREKVKNYQAEVEKYLKNVESK